MPLRRQCTPSLRSKTDPHNLYGAGLTHVFWHRSGGLLQNISPTHHKVRNHWELLRIAVRQLVEEIKAGSHRTHNPKRRNQHTRMRRKVLLRTIAEPLGCIALDCLPHTLHLAVHMAVTNVSTHYPRARPFLVELSTTSLGRGARNCSTPSPFARARPTALYVNDRGGFPSCTSIPVPSPSGKSTAWLHLALYKGFFFSSCQRV
ncbi:putative retrotransposon hot spot (RHS) protein [Trypanosoma cruzi]|nr:putative retrotransposon hot spot (RHS) protein [Trypanosoma cruzi]